MKWLVSFKQAGAFAAIVVVVIGSAGYFPEWQIWGGITAFVLSWVYDIYVWWKEKRCKRMN